MKKKIMLFIGILLLATGCTTLKNDSLDHIITSTTSNVSNVVNIRRDGYKYYLPRGMRLLEQEESNEILSEDNYIYYLYVDYVSYYNKIKKDYTTKSDVYYSKQIVNGDQFGYIEVKKTTNEKYFIEIMYNYAKIEVIVEEKDINKTVAYAMSILSSVQYQDTVLVSLMNEDVLTSNEVEHNIFDTAKTESGYLQIVEEYGQYKEDDSVDPDFIQK